MQAHPTPFPDLPLPDSTLPLSYPTPTPALPYPTLLFVQARVLIALITLIILLALITLITLMTLIILITLPFVQARILIAAALDVTGWC